MLKNDLLSQAQLDASVNNFTRAVGSGIQTGSSSETGIGVTDGLGGTRPVATPADGLGGAGMVDCRTAPNWIWIGSLALMFLL